jgi:hypothetical protein
LPDALGLLFDNTPFAFQESFYASLLSLFGRSVLNFVNKPQVDMTEKVHFHLDPLD